MPQPVAPLTSDLAKKYRQQRRGALTLYGVALLLLLSIFAWILYEQYRQELQTLETRNAARADVVVEWAKGVFAQSGQALFSVAELVQLQGMPTEGESSAIQQALRNRTRSVDWVDDIGVIDAEGIVQASARSADSIGRDLSSSSFFQKFRDQDDRTELVTPLYSTAPDERYYLYQARRLTRDNGEFDGIAVARISPAVFERALQRLGVSNGESIALVDGELKLIARLPSLEDPFTAGWQVDSPETLAMLERDVDKWSLRVTSPLDQRERLFQMQWIEELPLLVVVGEDVHLQLANWRQRAGILAGVMLLIAILGAWGVRHYLNRLRFEHRLHQSEAELRISATAFQTHLGMLIADANGHVLKVNNTFTRITGYSEAELVGKSPRMLNSGRHDAAFYRKLWQRVQVAGSWEGEIWSRRKNGDVFPEWLTISAVYDPQGTLTHYVATMSDISESKAAEQEIHQLAFYDPLTGLANRRLFMDRMEAALKDVNRHSRWGALLFIDIDNFKQINDTLGHYVGDQLLQHLARLMGQMLRETDTLARLGSDEFAVLIEGLGKSREHTAELAENIAQKLQDMISQPMTVRDDSLSVTASIGITVVSDHTSTVDDYLQQADMALFQAKSSGRCALSFFDPTMQAELLARVRLENELRQALANEEWQLYFQPQVDQDGRCIGVEGLLRWQHPERGLVMPGVFIPLLESTELINPVGDWVLEAACQQLAQWAHQPGFAELSVAVNVSPLQFRQVDFVNKVESILQRTGAPSHKLKLEVTESLFVEERDDAREKMLQLKQQGVRFALDDYGTGYSSLAYLAHLPLDQLKIDQSFVQQVIDSKANAAIVESTIALAQSLSLEIVAEGVERDDQQAWLLAHGCRAYQGFLYGKAMPLNVLEMWLRHEHLAL
ncbi:EAL domain-containing protein [Halomonas janggokensis]|jgi:diguanylate cyclase (GGDEF)-like protein/PAS domain S-box-containing protein|uniref:EAL domain-containing protein n=1 Tax=Vreelandella janggokensis TaxID=370767 RepID=A0ABT4ITY9_9GAMM|nr:MULTISPECIES: EAL domain-containing protein [Halomonas]MCW4150494.1 EAL domain-containing protein [Halomonas sp. 18H]MCZ0927132.1 EAL domain-containing protein [Halomonas janggokensis]MCZ0929640.1 EAL domain-containing protein [Halomonas janggokensis]